MIDTLCVVDAASRAAFCSVVDDRRGGSGGRFDHWYFGLFLELFCRRRLNEDFVVVVVGRFESGHQYGFIFLLEEEYIRSSLLRRRGRPRLFGHGTSFTTRGGSAIQHRGFGFSRRRRSIRR